MQSRFGPIELSFVSQSPPTIALEYAGRSTVGPPSKWLYLLGLWGTILAGAIGVLILMLFAITGAEPCIISGLYWLLIGGGITLIAFILGCIYALTGMTRKYPPPSTLRKALLVFLPPILNCGVAAGCFFGGIRLMGYHARSVIIVNKGTIPIDRIQLHAYTYKWETRTLAPGERVTAHFPARPGETLRMNVFVGTRSVPYVVAESMNADEMLGPRYVHLDGLTGYKNKQNSERSV